ncbi:MAG: hypothetical protein ACP5O0_08225 [Acidimicrobiales bacterium]
MTSDSRCSMLAGFRKLANIEPAGSLVLEIVQVEIPSLNDRSRRPGDRMVTTWMSLLYGVGLGGRFDGSALSGDLSVDVPSVGELSVLAVRRWPIAWTIVVRWPERWVGVLPCTDIADVSVGTVVIFSAMKVSRAEPSVPFPRTRYVGATSSVIVMLVVQWVAVLFGPRRYEITKGESRRRLSCLLMRCDDGLAEGLAIVTALCSRKCTTRARVFLHGTRG